MVGDDSSHSSSLSPTLTDIAWPQLFVPMMRPPAITQLRLERQHWFYRSGLARRRLITRVSLSTIDIIWKRSTIIVKQTYDIESGYQIMIRLVCTVYSCQSCNRAYSFVEDTFNDYSGLRYWSDGSAWDTYYNLRAELRLFPGGMLFWPNVPSFKVYNAAPSKIVKYERDPQPDSELSGNSKSRSWLSGLLRAKTIADDIGERIRATRSIIQGDIIHPVNIAGLYNTLSCDDVSLDHATEIENCNWLWWLWSYPNPAVPVDYADHRLFASEYKIISSLNKPLKLKKYFKS